MRLQPHHHNSRMNRTLGAAVALVLLPGILAAQRLPTKMAPKPTVGAITPADLMSRVYVFADDSMMGRQTATIYHDKGTDYIARELGRLGLQPAGDNGTFFQRLPIVSRTLASDASLTIDGRTFAAWTDFLPRDNGGVVNPLRNAVAIYGGVFGDTTGMVTPTQAAGKVVVFTVPRGYQANRPMLLQRYAASAGIVVATLDSVPAEIKRLLREPQPQSAGAPQQLPPVAFFYTTRVMAEAMFGATLQSLAVGATGKAVNGSLTFVESPSPGVRNVVAILPGSDPALRGQYVAIGAHSDHIGVGAPVDHDSLYAFYHIVRPQGADDGNKPATASDLPKVRALLDSLRRVRPPRLDSINNGADDDASGSMAMLEVAEAFATAREKPKRSILFVWHVAEEQGLIGADYFTENPTVPRDSIVGQINVDMIGRGGAADIPGGGAGYLQLIGSRRLSTELGELVEAEGKKFSPAFKFDYQYDANGHPGQYYCRSDHYMYARYGIPVVFMSTGGHAEYHQITDEPQYLDYDQLARVTQLVFNTANRVANLDHRLVVDKPKPDPKGSCRQ
jgi:hypothetical protein